MDGRRIRQLFLAGVLGGAAGCNSAGQKTSSGAAVQLPPQQESKLSRLLHGGPPGPPVQKPEVVAARPKQAMKPETDVTFADVQVEAAYIDGRPSHEQNQLLDEARARYQKVLAAQPGNADALRGLARLYTRIGNKERAYATFEQLVAAHPRDHKAMHELALTCGRFDDWKPAAAACERALQADPENRRYARTYGVCLARTGQYEKGFDAMAKVMPEAEARFTMAQVMLDGDQPEMGKQQMQLALQADPTFEPAKQWLTGGVPPAAEAAANDVRQVGFDPR